MQPNKANERQVAGEHYKAKYQHWDWVVQTQLPYLPAQVSKYLTRWKKKNGLQDLEKAKHFLDKFIEEESARKSLALDNTEKFTADNEVGAVERTIIHNLMIYHMSKISILEEAAYFLQRLIDVAKQDDGYRGPY